MILTVPWGNEALSMEISSETWENVRAGKKLTLASTDAYDGEEFVISWRFNSHPTKTLIVTYGEGLDMGEAYVGRMEDADIEP